MAAFAEEHGFGEADGYLSPEGLGRQPPALLGHADPDALLRRTASCPCPTTSCPCCLPEQIEITQQGGSPLGRVPEFVNATCPKCGGPARRETDTMDTFVDSSWYFYRYPTRTTHRRHSAGRRSTYWFPIDQYIGGVEHAILHLIYSRFWTKVMRDLGLVSNDEPVDAPLHPGHGDQERREDVEVQGQRGLARRHGRPLRRRRHAHVRALCRAARSRSRLAGGWRGRRQPLPRPGLPLGHALPGVGPQSGWSTSAAPTSPLAQALLRKLHQTISKITQDFAGRWHFNTCIAAIMELVNEITAAEPGLAEMPAEDSAQLMASIVPSLVLLLAPFAPYLAAELWSEIGGTGVAPAPAVAELRSRPGARRGARSAGAGQRQAARGGPAFA